MHVLHPLLHLLGVDDVVKRGGWLCTEFIEEELDVHAAVQQPVAVVGEKGNEGDVDDAGGKGGCGRFNLMFFFGKKATF